MFEKKNIVYSYAAGVEFNDPLDKATYTLMLKETIDYIEYIGYVDVDILWNLYHLKIKFVQWLMEYENIKEEEAIDLIKNKSVMFLDFIRIINDQIDLLSLNKG